MKNYNGENEKNNENDEGILKQDLIFNIIIKNIKKYDFISNNFSIKVDKIKLSNDFFFVKFKFLKLLLNIKNGFLYFHFNTINIFIKVNKKK